MKIDFCFFDLPKCAFWQHLILRKVFQLAFTWLFFIHKADYRVVIEKIWNPNPSLHTHCNLRYLFSFMWQLIIYTACCRFFLFDEDVKRTFFFDPLHLHQSFCCTNQLAQSTSPSSYVLIHQLFHFLNQMASLMVHCTNLSKV